MPDQVSLLPLEFIDPCGRLAARSGSTLVWWDDLFPAAGLVSPSSGCLCPGCVCHMSCRVPKLHSPYSPFHHVPISNSLEACSSRGVSFDITLVRGCPHRTHEGKDFPALFPLGLGLPTLILTTDDWLAKRRCERVARVMCRLHALLPHPECFLHLPQR